MNTDFLTRKGREERKGHRISAGYEGRRRGSLHPPAVNGGQRKKCDQGRHAAAHRGEHSDASLVGARLVEDYGADSGLKQEEQAVSPEGDLTEAAQFWANNQGYDNHSEVRQEEEKQSDCYQLRNHAGRGGSHPARLG
jgi:hypothetical protein